MITQENIPYTADEIKVMVKTIEELRKKYNKALERAKVYHTGGSISDAHITEVIFPELKESESERIRKELIAHFRNTRCVTEEGAEKMAQWVAWLEKQGEQKPNEWHCEDEQNLNTVLAYIKDECLRRWFKDIIHAEYEQCVGCINDKGCVTCVDGNMKETNGKPKFHEGEWLQYRNAKPFFVEEITKQGYINGVSCLPFEWEDEIHIWTIQDAKDGDVLVASDGSIFLFAGVDDCACKYYVALTTDNYVKINKKPKGGYWETSRAVYPATKEQQDLFFEELANAGYEWDADKKELSK